MADSKTPRATVLVEWPADGHQGILVHADRYRNTWILPGGGVEQHADGTPELPVEAAVRELYEETRLTTKAVRTLFVHQGAHRQHHVFQIWASGRLTKIIDRKEAPAFAICGPDLTPHLFLCEDGYVTDALVLSASAKAILTRYYQPHVAPAPATDKKALTTRIITDRSGSLLHVQIGSAILELTGGDLVKQDVDAVVNAANKHLANGGGVAGAIFTAAGATELSAACQPIGGCPTGEARITAGFRLKARHIIHAVGPRYDAQNRKRSARLLASAYRSSLELASQHQITSIAFPSISTGIYGYPAADAAPVALQTVIDYLRSHPEIHLVRFVLWSDNLDIYAQALRQLVGV